MFIAIRLEAIAIRTRFGPGSDWTSLGFLRPAKLDLSVPTELLEQEPSGAEPNGTDHVELRDAIELIVGHRAGQGGDPSFALCVFGFSNRCHASSNRCLTSRNKCHAIRNKKLFTSSRRPSTDDKAHLSGQR